jgi:hypothetical protein
MSIGFIPSNDNHMHEARELSAAREQWLAQQIAEACELNATMKDAYQVLLEEARKYALQLELIDPEAWSAEQERAAVILRLSYIETWQERLEVLIAEGHRLKRAIAEVRRKRFALAQPPSIPSRPARMRGGLLSVLFLGLGIFMGVLMAHGAL